MTVPYIIRSRPHSVEVWSGYQIQFDGMHKFDWQDALVGELKAALIDAAFADGGTISGSYGCTVSMVCDVENRLFTNPGAPTFPHGIKTIRWERSTHIPPPPRPIDEVSGRHYYRYSASGNFQLWSDDGILARWNDVPRQLANNGSARPTWLALREALVADEVDVVGESLPVGARFGVRIEVRAPARGPHSAPALSETLVDGVLCALHQGTSPADAPKIAQALKATFPAESIKHLTELVAMRTAPLPGSPFRLSSTRIQLSPRDEFCDAGEVVIRSDPTVSVPHLSGALFRLRPLAHAGAAPA